MKEPTENVIKTVYRALKNGSVFTRISFVIMGFGQMARGQL